LFSCATPRALEDREREQNPEITSCEVLLQKIRFRDQFFSAIKGRAELVAGKDAADLELVIQEPQFLRAEVVGPLGIRVALAQLNDRWGSVYYPKQKILRRIPIAELEKNSRRRDRFLESIGLPVYPDILAQSALSRVGFSLVTTMPGRCAWDPERRAYWFSWESKHRLIWVHPGTFAPLRVEYFDGKFPGEPLADRRPTWVVDYSDFRGEGPSTLPFRLVASFGGQPAFSLRWKEAEATKNVDFQLFDWTPKGEFEVQEF
jgi:hypothetical protein